ncbi:MAG: UbiA-like polyprenyltransferase [bacterium]
MNSPSKMSLKIADASQNLVKMVTLRWLFLTLPFALMGAVLPFKSFPPAPELFWIFFAFFNARNGGMFVNRLVDRKIDAENPRTRHRLLPSGQLSVSAAIMATIVSFLLYIWSAYQLNPLCFRLSPIPIFFICCYPYAKRFTWGLHFLLGITMAFAPLGAWIAVGGPVGLPVVLLSVAVLLWGAAFDIVLDNQDTDFYKQKGLHSLPAALGYTGANLVALLTHLTAMALFFYLAALLHMGMIFYAGLGVIAVLLAYEYGVAFFKGLESYQRIVYRANIKITVFFFLFTVFDIYLGK